MSRRTYRFATNERGIALIVVLLLLLLVTLLGLAAMRGSLLQERMSGNLRARSVAFQAAEAVLRVGESYAAGRPEISASLAGTSATDPATCEAGLCGMPWRGAASQWEADGFWDDDDKYRSAEEEIDCEDCSVAAYVVEDLGQGSISDECTSSIDLTATGCSSKVQFYRVVAHVRLSNGAQVTLQSRYRVN